MNISKEKYKIIIDKNKNKTPYIKNCFASFIFGGTICVIGEIFKKIYENIFHLSSKESTSYMIMTLIFIGSILTGLGLYDKLGQIGKAGTLVPITGFSNSVTSSSMEYKQDGFVLGLLNNSFKLAGVVIIASVLTGFLIGILYLLWGVIY